MASPERVPTTTDNGNMPLPARVNRSLEHEGLQWSDLDDASARLLARIDQEELHQLWPLLRELPRLPVSLVVKRAAVSLALARATDGGYDRRGAKVLLDVGPELGGAFLEEAGVRGFSAIQAWVGEGDAERLAEWDRWFALRDGNADRAVNEEATEQASGSNRGNWLRSLTQLPRRLISSVLS